MRWSAGLHWSSMKGWCGVFALMTDGRFLLRHELVFRGLSPEVAAAKLRVLTADEGITLSGVYAQPAIFPSDRKKGGETISEAFYRLGIPLIKANDDPINGWSRVRALLVVKQWPSGPSPSLLVHTDCRYFLKTFPFLIAKTTDPDDIEENVECYPANGLRYFAMSRPAPRPESPRAYPKGSFGERLEQIRSEGRRSPRAWDDDDRPSRS